MKAVLILGDYGAISLNVTDLEGFVNSILLARLDPKFDVVQIPFKFSFIPLKLSSITSIWFDSIPTEKLEPIITIEEAKKVYADRQ